MKQGWYWLAAGVMALGLNGVYHQGGAEWTHRLVNRSAAVVALASGRAERFLGSAREQTTPRATIRQRPTEPNA